MKRFPFKILCLIINLAFILPVYAQHDSVTISGHLAGLGDKNVFISFKDNAGENVSFRSGGKSDNFSIKIPIQVIPTVARFDVGIKRGQSAKVGDRNIGNPVPPLNLFVWDKNITITGDAMLVQFASVKGDSENNKFEELNNLIRKDEIQMFKNGQSLFQAKYLGGELKRTEQEIQNENEHLRESVQKKRLDFVNKNPDALASLFLLNRSSAYYTADGYADAFNQLSERVREHPLAEGIKKMIERTSATRAGTPAIQFERRDKDGKDIRLADYKGKVVLLDFWGSWCGPCRASHPHLKELYQKYHKDGFEIIAIAHELGETLEASRKSWLDAIAEDGINWIQILNMDGIEKQDIIKDYSISAFPTKILVGKDGKIILRITSSATDDIDNALKKIYAH